MVLLWDFRVPLSGSRPTETRTSHVWGPREMSCPAFRAIRIPPAQKRAHRSHTCGKKIKNYRGFERMLLIEESQRRRSGLVLELAFETYALSVTAVLMPIASRI